MGGGGGGKLGGAEEGISHIEMRVLLSVFSLSPCITPWITTTPPLCRRNFQAHPQHAHKHTPPSPSSFPPFLPPSFRPLVFTELGREGLRGERGKQMVNELEMNMEMRTDKQQGASLSLVWMFLCVCVCFSIIFSKYTNNKQFRLSIVSR